MEFEIKDWISQFISIHPYQYSGFQVDTDDME